MIENNVFNNNMLKLMGYENNSKNVIISPLSIKIALGMLLNGCVGKSKEELESLLGVNAELLNQEIKRIIESSGDEVKYANVLWFDYPNKEKEEFRRILEEYYKSEIRVDDFSKPNMVDTINNWVSEHTNKLIKEVLKMLSSKSLLINTLYFKAAWSNPISEYSTYDDVFHGINGDKTVKMMRPYSSSYFENDYAKGFSLYYDECPYQFVAILPNKEGNFKIEDLDLNSFHIMDGDYAVEAVFPRLDVDFDTDLVNSFKKMNIISLFQNQNDLINMLETPQIVDRIIHMTKLKLDENGTEAAAATVIMTREGASFHVPTRVVLKFDRPFAFMINNYRTNEILFIGKIVDL